MASPQDTPTLTIEVSPGELLDKITILEIKSAHIDDPAKLENVSYELGLYQDICSSQLPINGAVAALIGELRIVNEALWNIEDEIRACEAHQEFGEKFVELARKVYRTNDRRASIKREINILCGSPIIEEKSYTQY